MFKVTKIEHEVYCPVCNTTFSVGNKGKLDLEQHLSTNKHQQKIRTVESSAKINSFFKQPNTKIEEQVSAAEGTLAFHTVKHHFSFKSCDCSTKLIKKIMPDSEIGKKISCARTKTEAIVTSVLTPYSIEFVTAQAKKCNFIGISTDASNHGHLKIFPVLIQFFDKKLGLTVKIIELSNLNNEKSETIVHYLTEILQKHDLNDNCVAFAGDNCNTNFGGAKRVGKKNVFSGLKEIVNHDIIGVGCPAHILNNCIQNGTDSLPIDIDSLILKIYNHFSIYTIRTESLKSFCEFVDVDYKKLLYHSKTRWLSLFPCINRILEIYDGLQSFFLSDGSSPAAIKKFFENRLNEAYFWFLHSLMYVFHENIKLIEREDNSVLEVLECLENVRICLKQRIEEQFLPLKVKQIFKQNLEMDSEIKILKKNFLYVYERCLQYLENWTRPLNDFKLMQWMNLRKQIEWKDVQNSLEFFQEKNVNINESKLFNQYCNFKTFLETAIKTDDFVRLQSHQKWQKYFEAYPDEEASGEWLKICQFFFAIPAHNANVERIFSVMNVQWSDERNRLNVTTIRAILITYFNFKEFSCQQFFDYLSCQKSLLKKISSSDKYQYSGINSAVTN